MKELEIHKIIIEVWIETTQYLFRALIHMPKGQVFFGDSIDYASWAERIGGFKWSSYPIINERVAALVEEKHKYKIKFLMPEYYGGYCLENDTYIVDWYETKCKCGCRNYKKKDM